MAFVAFVAFEYRERSETVLDSSRRSVFIGAGRGWSVRQQATDDDRVIPRSQVDFPRGNQQGAHRVSNDMFYSEYHYVCLQKRVY